MDTCTVETGLLKKKPCGEKAVSRCGNCEQPLCGKHAVGQMSAGKKTFLCPDCAKAWKAQEKAMGEPAAPHTAPKPAPAAKPAAAPQAATAAKPAAAPKPAAPAAAAAKAEQPPKEEKKKDDGDAPLEFTPTKK